MIHVKVVLMEPKAFKYLMGVQKKRDDAALTRMVTGAEPEEEQEEEMVVIKGEKNTEEDRRRVALTKILDLSRLDIQVGGGSFETYSDPLVRSELHVYLIF